MDADTVRLVAVIVYGVGAGGLTFTVGWLTRRWDGK